MKQNLCLLVAFKVRRSQWWEQWQFHGIHTYWDSIALGGCCLHCITRWKQIEVWVSTLKCLCQTFGHSSIQTWFLPQIDKLRVYCPNYILCSLPKQIFVLFTCSKYQNTYVWERFQAGAWYGRFLVRLMMTYWRFK